MNEKENDNSSSIDHYVIRNMDPPPPSVSSLIRKLQPGEGFTVPARPTNLSTYASKHGVQIICRKIDDGFVVYRVS